MGYPLTTTRSSILVSLDKMLTPKIKIHLGVYIHHLCFDRDPSQPKLVITCNNGMKKPSAVVSGKTRVTSPPPAFRCSRSSAARLDGKTAKCLSCLKYRSRKNRRHFASFSCVPMVTYLTSGVSAWLHVCTTPEFNIRPRSFTARLHLNAGSARTPCVRIDPTRNFSNY